MKGPALFAPLFALVALFPAPTPPAPPTPMPAVKPLVGGPRNPDGTEIQDDLPTRLQVKNRGGWCRRGRSVRLRESGACRPLAERAADRRHHSSGCGRSRAAVTGKGRRHDRPAFKEEGTPKPDYLQVEGDDFEILRTACKTGRMPAVTYGYSPTGRYGRAHIAHMVNLVHADEK